MTATASSRASVLARCRAAADVLRDYAFEYWHYGDSVGFEGLLAATDLLDDPAYLAFFHGAVRAWLASGRPFRELDNTAPGHALCSLYEATGDERVLQGAVELAGHLRRRRRYRGAYVAFERAPLRAPYDATHLPVSEQQLLTDPGPGVFVDCLHFDAPFFVHLGRLTGDDVLVADGVGQAIAYCDLLQDEEDGLFAHFVLERTGSRYGHAWSRGQGWALLGLVDVLAFLPADHAERPRLVDALRRQAAGLRATQHPSGHWGALAGDLDESSAETSASFFVAAGFHRAIALGLLDADHRATAQRAWEAGCSKVGRDGRIDGVSAAVWCSTSVGHYRAVPVGFQVPWGQGPFLLAAARWLADDAGANGVTADEPERRAASPRRS